MKFTDFEPKELIGIKVIIRSNDYAEIKTIERVTKAGFGFNNSNDLFSFIDGKLNGGSIWHHTYAEIISEEKANELTIKWDTNRLAKNRKKELSDSLKNLTNEETEIIYKLFKTLKP